MRNRFFWFFLLALTANHADAAEREIVCARYQTEYGWSNGYKVEATILKGSELNRATRSYDYSSYSIYVVIFWSQNQASIIEMDLPYLSSFGQEGEDQQGRKWEIAKTNLCF